MLLMTRLQDKCSTADRDTVSQPFWQIIDLFEGPSSAVPATIDDLLRTLPWFSGPSEAPWARTPTPLLTRKQYEHLRRPGLPPQGLSPERYMQEARDAASRRVLGTRLEQAAHEAVVSGLSAAESNRQSLGQRMRRSISRVGQRLNCFRRSSHAD